MNTFAKFLILFSFFGFLLDKGGEGDYAQLIFSVILLLESVFLFFALPRKIRFSGFDWIIFLFTPLILLYLIQIFPLGFHHHWLNEDLDFLNNVDKYKFLSIDLEATNSCLFWAITLFSSAIVFSILFRGSRICSLADSLIIIAGLHAFWGLVVLLSGLEWPTTNNNTHCHSSFVYANHAASFWGACLPITLLTAKYYGTWWRWTIAALLILAILFSGSRGGILLTSLVCIPLSYALLPSRNRILYALAILIVLSAWLSLIGMQDLRNRFDALRGPSGLTLDGRVIIWKNAIPLALDAGPIGCGGGTTTEAYRRINDSSFAPRIVDHLHNDLLEWWLEFGWVGLILGFLGVFLFILSLREKIETPKELSYLIIYKRGSFWGIVILSIYSFFDFIMHNPAVNLLLIILITIYSQFKFGLENSPKRSMVPFRIAIFIISTAIIITGLERYGRESENILAQNVGSITYQRIKNHLPIELDGPLIQEAINKMDPSLNLAIMQSWLSRNGYSSSLSQNQRLSIAKNALNIASMLSPGDSRAWSERAFYYAENKSLNKAIYSIHRALDWAPIWFDIQAEALKLYKNNLFGYRNEFKKIVNDILLVNSEQPEWFFPIADDIIGSDALSAGISSAGIKLKRSGIHWLLEKGKLSDWLTTNIELTDFPIALSDDLAPIASKLFPGHEYTVITPLSLEDQRKDAEMLLKCGFTLNENLRKVLSKRGLPWSIWSLPINLSDIGFRMYAKNCLRSELHLEWAKKLIETIMQYDRVYSGDWKWIDRNYDPELIFMVLSKKINNIPDYFLNRCDKILARYSSLEFEYLGDHIRFSYLYKNKNVINAHIYNKFWTGLFIDGNWIGWIRGDVDITPLISPGLHRVSLIEP